MNRRILSFCGLLLGLLFLASSCKNKKDTPRLELSSVELRQTVWNGTLEYKSAKRVSYSVYLNFLSDSEVEVSAYDSKDPTASYYVQADCFYTITDRIFILKTQGDRELHPSMDQNAWYLIRKEPSLLVFQANAGNPDREATLTLRKKL